MIRASRLSGIWQGKPVRSMNVPQTRGYSFQTSSGIFPSGFARLSLYFFCRSEITRTASSWKTKFFASFTK
jgi:hypothetical protein